MEIIGQVWSGQAGLARTYWLFGVIAGIAWGIPLSLVTPGSPLAMSVVGLFVAYTVIVNVGIWRAASQYEGPKVWAVLAKAAVAALPALLVVGTILAIVLPAIQTSKSEQIDWERGKITPPPSEIDAFLAAPLSLEEAKNWTQENTGSSENGPWLNHAPGGARFCRLSDRTIVVLFPPGVRPQAEKAEAVCAAESVATSKELGFTYEEVAGKEATTGERWKQGIPVEEEWWKKDPALVQQPNGQDSQHQGLKPFTGKLDGQ